MSRVFNANKSGIRGNMTLRFGINWIGLPNSQYHHRRRERFLEISFES